MISTREGSNEPASDGTPIDPLHLPWVNDSVSKEVGNDNHLITRCLEINLHLSYSVHERPRRNPGKGEFSSSQASRQCNTSSISQYSGCWSIGMHSHLKQPSKRNLMRFIADSSITDSSRIPFSPAVLPPNLAYIVSAR